MFAPEAYRHAADVCGPALAGQGGRKHWFFTTAGASHRDPRFFPVILTIT